MGLDDDVQRIQARRSQAAARQAAAEAKYRGELARNTELGKQTLRRLGREATAVLQRANVRPSVVKVRWVDSVTYYGAYRYSLRFPRGWHILGEHSGTIALGTDGQFYCTWQSTKTRAGWKNKLDVRALEPNAVAQGRWQQCIGLQSDSSGALFQIYDYDGRDVTVWFEEQIAEALARICS